MLDFSGVRRDYKHARENYTLEVPGQFNFAFDVIDAHTASSPDQTAIVAVSGDDNEVSPISYQWLTQSSNQFANALESLGLTAGDFAAVVIPRVPAWYTVMFACMKLGVVSMPGTSLLTGKDIAYRVQKSSAKAVIVGEEHCALIDEVRESCPTLTTFIVVGKAREGWLSVDELCAGASDEFDRDARPRNNAEDIMMAYFTSGTTSMPKLVPRSYGIEVVPEVKYAIMMSSLQARPRCLNLCLEVMVMAWLKSRPVYSGWICSRLTYIGR